LAENLEQLGVSELAGAGLGEPLRQALGHAVQPELAEQGLELMRAAHRALFVWSPARARRSPHRRSSLPAGS
jgi:hypothetical protein